MHMLYHLRLGKRDLRIYFTNYCLKAEIYTYMFGGCNFQTFLRGMNALNVFHSIL
jgi:hypothetical protein